MVVGPFLGVVGVRGVGGIGCGGVRGRWAVFLEVMVGGRHGLVGRFSGRG